MKLVVGLGNPGTEYIKNRHNLGFWVLNYFAETLNLNLADSKHEHKSLIIKANLANLNGEGVFLVKPLTYMNLCGQAVQAVMHYYKINLADLLIITEDINLDLGTMKIRGGGSAGGHNGLKSIAQHVGSDDYNRLRIGVGYDPRIPLDRYVLSNFPKADEEIIESGLPLIANCIEDFLKGVSLKELMGIYNGKWQ